MIEIVTIAIIVTELIMIDPIGAEPIEITTNTVPRTTRAAANRGIGMIAVATAPRDRVGLQIATAKWIAHRADLVTTSIEAMPRRLLAVADRADLLVRAPALNAVGVTRLPQ